MLRKNIRNWIRHEKMLRESGAKRKTKSPRERAKYNRIRRSAIKAIQDMTFLLENLPEKQLDQIFTLKRNNDKEQTPMESFLRALFSLETEDEDSTVRRRVRVKRLWHFILNEFTSHKYIVNLVGKDVWRFFTRRKPEAIEAIFYGTSKE